VGGFYKEHVVGGGLNDFLPALIKKLVSTIDADSTPD
jgi:hypothetical protein